MRQLLLLDVLDVLDDIAHALKLFRLFVGNFMAKFLFQRHHELDCVQRVGPEVLAKGRVPVSAPLLFTANDCFDIGVCLGSPVSLDYYDKAPFPFDGQIDRVHIVYT